MERRIQTILGVRLRHVSLVHFTLRSEGAICLLVSRLADEQIFLFPLLLLSRPPIVSHIGALLIAMPELASDKLAPPLHHSGAPE